MKILPRDEELRDRYRHAGFYPSRKVTVAPWDSAARVIRLRRRSKKLSAAGAVWSTEAGMTAGGGGYEISRVEMLASSWNLMCVA